ncbi:MAG TPA: hypothetical protein EYP19_01235 [Desulfobacterales bacterium]|nr:hypothetical protein [Desulfobacterales bacterium]
MHTKEKPLRVPSLFAGVGLTSLATLMLQVTLTRLFSVALWHHFAFMVVSIAFLGYAASGTFLMMAPRMKTLPLRPTLALLALGFSMTTLAAYWSSNAIPFDPARIIWDRYQWIYLFGYYGVLAIPFFFAGLILALVYTCKAAAINRLYACDLVGAGLGCIAILWIYSFAGEAGTVVLVCLVSGFASLVFSARGWKVNLVRSLWMVLLCVLVFTRPAFLTLNISPYKALKVALRSPDARILETQWHPAGRLDVIESQAVRFAPGLSLEFQGSLPEQLGLCLDGGHLNAVTRFTGDIDRLAFVEFLPASLPYSIADLDHVLVVEPLGGLDILTARYHGARNIVTTHANPMVLRIMRDSLKDFSGNLYENKATAIEEQARSFLLGTSTRFDLIHLPLTDSLGAVSSGLYGLSEDYTLTVDAFRAYMRALTPQGFLTVTKYLLPPPRHELRLAALACAALEAEGVKHPKRHVAAIRSWGTFTLLVKRSLFEPQEIRRIKGFCRRTRCDLVYYPQMPRAEANQYNRFPGPIYHDTIQKILNPHTRQAFYKAYLFDVRPVTDDRPFFYHSFRIEKLISLYRAVGNKWQLFLEGGYLIHLIFFQAAVICLVLMTLPLKKAGLPPSCWFLSYFGLIGIAFMLTEICLIQRFILFLARPAYAVSVVLFSLLVASAFGSFYSKRLTVPATLTLTPALLIAYAFLLNRLLVLAIAWPLWMRYGTAFFLILPLGFTMGMFFPMGMRTLTLYLESAIPWAWAVNASLSVVGSVLAVLIALSFGFKSVLLLASLVYVIALSLLAIIRIRRPHVRSQQAV